MRCFTKVSGEEIEAAFFYPYDLINTKTTIPLRVGEEQWIYTLMLHVLVYIQLKQLSPSGSVKSSGYIP